jgi:hypothetical protein
MSAAATAAGYLYASGRLRGRTGREQEEPQRPQQKTASREKIRVAVYQPEPQPAPAPRRTPKIEYRTRRRWAVE